MHSLRSPVHEALRMVLRRARKSAGLRQKQLARRVHSSQSIISMIETGGRSVDVPELVELARALGADPKELLTQAIEMAGRPGLGKRLPPRGAGRKPSKPK